MGCGGCALACVMDPIVQKERQRTPHHERLTAMQNRPVRGGGCYWYRWADHPGMRSLIIAVSSSLSETSRQPKLKTASMHETRSSLWWRDSNQIASGKPGAIHFAAGTDNGACYKSKASQNPTRREPTARPSALSIRTTC